MKEYQDKNGLIYQKQERTEIIGKKSVEVLEVVDYVGHDTTVVIPSSFEDMPITNIVGCCSSSFTSKKVEELVIEEGITTIEDGALSRNAYLKKVTLPKSLKLISEGLFYKCTALTEISILGDVESIYRHAFAECENLHTVVLSDNITYIGNEAFANCTALQNINIPLNINAISGDAFIDCNLIFNIFENGKYLGNQYSDYFTLFGVVDKNCENFTFHNDTSYLFTGACHHLINMEEISIPHGIKYIPVGMFKDCTNLTTVTLPETINDIGYYAFKGCTALQDVLIYATDLQEILQEAFADCTSLKTITLPAGIKKIDRYCFKNCTALKEIYISKMKRNINYNMNGRQFIYSTIDTNAFYNCTSLTNIYYSDTVENWLSVTNLNEHTKFNRQKNTTKYITVTVHCLDGTTEFDIILP